MGLLPRSKAPSHHSSDGKPSSNTWMKAFIIVMCCLNAYYVLSSLHPSCAPARQLLSSTEAAAILEAGSTQQLLLSNQELPQQDIPQQQQQQETDDDQEQAQQTAAALSASSCAVKVEDISSWAGAGLSEGPFSFPKIIHQTVEDKVNVSCEALACMQTWMDMNPGYEHRLVDAAERHEFVATYYPEVLKVYESLGTNVERADLWRYLALHRYGGVYADSDVRCMKPVDEWNAANGHDADLLLGVVFTDKRNMVTRVNNFILAAMPCHPVMAAMPFTTMSRITQSALTGGSVKDEKGKGLTNGVVGRTGPVALTGTIQQYAARHGAPWPVSAEEGAVEDRGNLVGRVRLMPRNVMTMGWETAEKKISCEEAAALHPGAYICHQYFGTWKADYKHRPSLTFSDRCTYEGLREQYVAGQQAQAQE